MANRNAARTPFDYRWVCVGLALLLAAAPAPKLQDDVDESGTPTLRSAPQPVEPKL